MLVAAGPVCIIRGPSAVGKSTLARQLALLHLPSLSVNIDELHGWITDGRISGEHIRLTLQAAAQVARTFSNAGYSVFTEFALVRRWEVDAFVESLGVEPGTPVHLITLLADATVLEHRDAARSPSDVMGIRVVELFGEFQQSDETRGYFLDTSALSLDEVIAAVEHAMTSGKSRL